MLYGLLGALQGRPQFLSALITHAANTSASLHSSLQKWTVRTPLYCEPLTAEQFCVLATQRARLIDLEFADFLLTKVTYQAAYCARFGSYRFGDAVRGGSLWVESRDVGPAEVVHEEEYVAEYWGEGWARRLSYLQCQNLAPECWEEPYQRSAS
jgi:hypothetical protein